MIYQVTANLYFNIEDEAKDFFHDCELAYHKAIPVNPGNDNAEFNTIELIENHHDEDPNQSCTLLNVITDEN